MRKRRALKGQILILVLLVLLGLVVVFALLSRFPARVRAAPTVREASWSVDGQQVTTARLGEKVKAHVVIQATEEYIGSVIVKIRKDVSLWPDSDSQVSTIPINLRGGEEKEIELSFTPDETSRDGLGGLRGYFIEVEFRVTRTTWVMENSYPPRLRVTGID